MICKKCGEVLPDNARFCGSCGSKLEITDTVLTDDKTSEKFQFSDDTSKHMSDHSGEKEVLSNTVSTEKTKKGFEKNLKDNKKLILAAVIGVVFVFAVIIIIVAIQNQMSSNNDYYNDEYYNDEYYNDEYYDDYDSYEENDFYVYLNPNNGDFQDNIYMSEPGFVPEPSEPVREGYEFEGWYTDESFNEKWNFDTDEATGTLTLYANWVEDEDDKKLVLAVDGLRLRDRPDINGRQVGLIPNGTKITITETKNGWAYTNYKGVTGWCSCEFLYDPADYENQMLFKAYVKNRSGIDLYSEKSTNSSVEKYGVRYKSYVQVYEVDDKWSYVYYDGKYGWCLSDDIDDVK